MANGLGVTKAAISSWETGKNVISQPIALSIEYIFGISSRWILEGIPPQFSRQHADQAAGDMSRPLLQGAPSCGPGGEIQDPGPSAKRYNFHVDLPFAGGRGLRSHDDLFYARVAGDSMRPTINDGDLVLLDVDLEQRITPRSNGVYLVRRHPADLDTRVKRVRLDEARHQLVLSSDNHSYPPLTVELDDVPLHQLLLGRVLWVGHFLLESPPPERDW